jgi:hypothetical protein
MITDNPLVIMLIILMGVVAIYCYRKHPEKYFQLTAAFTFLMFLGWGIYALIKLMA